MPPYWKTFVEQHQLIGREFLLPDDVDLSGVGADIEILGEANILNEQTESYSGIAVASAGFIPVGNCGIGTGDPYFINVHDGEGGPLYRIYHDELINEQYDAKTAIAIVLQDYRQLLKHMPS
jgi:hypothetical protein